MARRCLVVTLAVSVVVFLLSSTTMAFLYKQQQQQKSQEAFEHEPLLTKIPVDRGMGQKEHSVETTLLHGDLTKAAGQVPTLPVLNVSDNHVAEPPPPSPPAHVEPEAPSPPALPPPTTVIPVSFDSLFSNEMANPNKEYFTYWLPDDSLVMLDDAGNWIHVNHSSPSGVEEYPAHGKVFLSAEEIGPYDEKKFSSDHRYVAVGSQVESVYRHSSRALYKVGRFVAGGGSGKIE